MTNPLDPTIIASELQAAAQDLLRVAEDRATMRHPGLRQSALAPILARLRRCVDCLGYVSTEGARVDQKPLLPR